MGVGGVAVRGGRRGVGVGGAGVGEIAGECVFLRGFRYLVGSIDEIVCVRSRGQSLAVGGVRGSASGVWAAQKIAFELELSARVCVSGFLV